MIWLGDQGLGRNTIGKEDVWGRNRRYISLNDTESEDKLRRSIPTLGSVTIHAHCH